MLELPRTTHVWRAIDTLAIEQVVHCEIIIRRSRETSIRHTNACECTRLSEPERRRVWIGTVVRILKRPCLESQAHYRLRASSVSPCCAARATSCGLSCMARTTTG